MLSSAGTLESSMSKAGLDNRHRNKDSEISGKHGNTLIRTLRRVYGQSFAAGYPETEKLSEVLLKLNETSLPGYQGLDGRDSCCESSAPTGHCRRRHSPAQDLSEWRDRDAPSG
jgi:hypothetical protein